MSNVESQVAGSAHSSLSLLSEPPDIRNWFSSYTYQSPVLDANLEFGDSLIRVDEEERGLFVEDSEDEDWKNSTRARKMYKSSIRGRITRSVIGKSTEGTRIQSHHPTVEVPVYPDSLSLPSEPPDIRNLFPSYVYESPALDTSEFGASLPRAHDCGDAKELENERNEIREDFTATDVQYEPSFQKKAILNSCATFTRPIKAENERNEIRENFASQVPACPDSLSLPSEPPDIRNWFSSYVYESPSLDSSDFDVSLSSRHNVGNIEELHKGREEDMKSLFVTNVENEPSYLMEAIPNCVATTTRSKRVEYGKNQEKDDLGGNNFRSKNNLYPERPSEKSSQGGTAALESRSNIAVKSNDCPRIQAEDTVPVLQERQPMSRLHVASPLKVEKKFIEAEIDSGWVLLKHKSREADHKIMKNKHIEPASVENKSTLLKKKASSKIDENSPNPLEPSKCMYNRNVNPVRSTYNGNNGVVKREALNEITNFQHSNEMEVAGKWKCPQRSKPNVGPPLKQLRLEKWVCRKNYG